MMIAEDCVKSHCSTTSLERGAIILNKWFSDGDDSVKSLVYLRSFIRFIKELSPFELEVFREAYYLRFISLVIQIFLKEHSWTIFDKTLDSTMFITENISTEILFLVTILKTSGSCSGRELYMMIISRISDAFKFSCFALIIPLMEHALKKLPATFWLTGTKNYKKVILVEVH